MRNQLKRLNSTGDTIVEVLIVLAVLGLAMSIAYATANHGLQQSRNAQEHSEALGILNSQIEILRTVYSKQASNILPPSNGTAFCLAPSTTAPAGVTQLVGFNEDRSAPDNLNTTVYPGPCNQNSLYYVSVVNRGGGLYDFRVRWEGLGQLGHQQEQLTYRIDGAGIASGGPGGGGYTDPEVPPVPAPPAPPSLSLTFGGPSSVKAGDPINLTWTTTPAGASCTALVGDWPTGSVASSGSKAISTTATDYSRQYNFTLRCTLGGDVETKSVSVQMNSTYQPLYRLWSAGATDHLYVVGAEAANNAGYVGYQNEGIESKIDTVKGDDEIPLYEVVSYAYGDHFYTTNIIEAALAMSYLGYQDLRTVGYVYSSTSCPAGTTPLYRSYSATYTDHFYTTNFVEYAYQVDTRHVPALGTYSQYEGVAACVYPN